MKYPPKFSRIFHLILALSLLLTGVVFSPPQPARALGELVEWISLNSSGNLEASFVAAEVTAVALSRVGVAWNDGSTYNSKEWATGAAIDPGKYLEWGIAPAAGYQLDLADFDIRYDRSSTGPAKLQIYVSTDNFASSVLVHTDDAVNASGEDNADISLSGVPVVAPGQTALFRLYGYNASAATGTFDIENVEDWGGTGIRIRGEAIPASGEYISLALNKTATPGAVEQGDLVVYTLKLTNNGTLSDTNVLMTDTLPSAVDFAHWITRPANTAINGREITWSGTVTNSQSITFTFAVTNLVNSGPIVNTAYFSGTQKTGAGSASYSVSGGMTRISAIQGEGASSPFVGQTHTIEAIVVGDYQASGLYINGFYVQEEDADADGNPLTSEGIFVYHTSTNVAVGDKVQVTGPVQEYNGMTQLGGGSSVSIVASNQPLPTPAQVTLPYPSADYLERFEGMLVEISQPLLVTEIFKLGRGGELLLSSGARLMQPTQVVAPGQPAIDLLALNNLNKIILDDGSLAQNPDPIIYPLPLGLSGTNTVRGGDLVENIVGVLSYSWSGYSGTDAYRIHPTQPPTFSAANPRPIEPPDVGGTLRIASFNVLNYFVTLGSRGATTAAEFTRQRTKIINAIVLMDADVVGLIEIENHSTDAALINLVDGLNTATASGTYAYINTGVIGADAIKQAFIYQPARVTPVGSYAILDNSFDPAFQDTRNRPALAQSFQHTITGEVVTVVVNHLKSKGSACTGDPDTGDGQGNCNLTRKVAAEILVNWLNTHPTGVDNGRYLVIGDLNSYAREDPIVALEAGGYTNLVKYFGDVYGYVFNGQWGTLDYAMASGPLLPYITGAEAFHINADEPIILDYNVEFKTPGQVASLYDPGPYRASDHDPAVVGLNFTRHFTWTGAAGATWGTAGSWSENIIPTYADSVYIPAGATPYPVLATDATVNYLTIAPGAGLTIPANYDLTIETGIQNYGTLSQTQTVSGPASFLHLTNRYGAPRYYGLDVTSATSLGATTVALRGQSQCTMRAGETVSRCFDIQPTNTGVSTTLKFYYQIEEMMSAGNYADVKAWHWDEATRWTAAGNPEATGALPGYYWVQVSSVTDFSPFVLRAPDAPTAIQVRAFSGRAGVFLPWGAVGLLVMGLCLDVRRRRAAR